MVKLTIDFIKKTSGKPSSFSKKPEEILKKITHLSLPEKSIDSIADISCMKNLTVIYLHHNNLQAVENLDKNEKLTHLFLQHNKIKKMENLDISHLKKLYLGHNCISVVEGLEYTNSLEELHIECQQLLLGETIYFDPRTIRNIANCLRVLDISGNNISSLNDLKELKAIERVIATNNALSDLPAVCTVVCHWPRIEELDLRGNTIVKEQKYRDKIIANTNYLRILDGKEINDITRTFIHRFETIKEERKEKMTKGSQEATPFSDEIASIAEHLPPGLRQAVSASVKKEALPRAKSLTLSLMQVPVNSPGFFSETSVMPHSGLLARPSKKITNAEKEARNRQKVERENHPSLPYLGSSITTGLR